MTTAVATALNMTFSITISVPKNWRRSLRASPKPARSSMKPKPKPARTASAMADVDVLAGGLQREDRHRHSLLANQTVA